MPHANHSHGPHIRIFASSWEKARKDRNVQVRLNHEFRLYRIVWPLWQSPLPAGSQRVNAKCRRLYSDYGALGTFDHAHVALDIARSKRLERLFVGGCVVAGERLVEAVELHQHHALVY